MRPDVHRPSEIVPNDYEFVACEHVRGEDFDNALFGQSERQRIHAHMTRTGGHYSLTSTVGIATFAAAST
jgi:hypothetical protein